MTKHIVLNAFDKLAASQVGHGLWRHPESQRRRFNDPDYWIEYAQLAERGRLDALFFADAYGVAGTYRGSTDTSIAHGIYFPTNDPSVFIPAMAAHTSHLGFGMTQSTSYEPAIVIARKLSSLDHVTKGRFGWNVVTSSSSTMARLHGVDLRDHDKRYDLADELLDLLYTLWEGAWEEGFQGRPSVDDFLYDPDKLHRIRFEGEHFKLDGFYPSEPSPQRTPFLFQAGNSPRGLAFAAKHAEVAMIAADTPAQARAQVAAVRELARAAGRDPAHLKFILTCVVVAEETDAAAQRRLADYRDHWSFEAALATSASYSGYDLASLDPDAVFEFHGTEQHQTGARALEQAARDGLLVRELIERVSGLGSQNLVISGGPSTVADQLEEWIDEGGLDGFNAMPFVPLVDTRHLVELVVPELVGRGRFRSEYLQGETLRERFFPGGGPKLADDHPGARFRRA